MNYKNFISCKVKIGMFPGTIAFEISPVIGSIYESATPRNFVYLGDINSGKLEGLQDDKLGSLWIPAWLEIQVIREIDRDNGKSEVLVLLPDGEIVAISDDRIFRVFQKLENLKIVEFC